MTIRWRLNLAVVAIVGVFLVVAGFSVRAVKRHGDFSRKFTQTREQSQLTSDIRGLLYQHLAAKGDVYRLPKELANHEWPDFVIDDIDVQIRLAQSGMERQLWSDLRIAMLKLSDVEDSGAVEPINTAIHESERILRDIRNYYDLHQYNMGAYSATSSFVEFAAMCAASAITALLFVIYLAMVRRWLVTPIEVLRTSTGIIGNGDLSHRVPLAGNDELADLARGIDAMAEGLAQRQAALVEARELSVVGELCANIAHGLRNPLAVIRATAQLAERRLNGAPEGSLMRELTDQTDRMDRRITKLFEFSRRIALQKSPTTFEQLAVLIRSNCESFLVAKNINMEVQDKSAGLRAELDCDQVIEAIVELVANASHHSPDGSTVELLGHRDDDGDTLVISVCDHGTGMEESTLRKALDPFFTSRPNGIGMGLTLVNRIAQRHGGALNIETAPGKGVCASILFPQEHKLAPRQNAESPR